MTRTLSDPDYRALAAFRHALRTFQRFSEQAARDAGLTPAQHQLLLAIRGHPGEAPPSLSAIAEVLQLRLHSAGELTSRAVANGLVDRWTDPDDARRIVLGLTPLGHAKLADLSLAHRAELRRFRAEMNDVLRELG